jgi:hypothetical protein
MRGWDGARHVRRRYGDREQGDLSRRAVAPGASGPRVTVFEALHDIGDPVGALWAARGLLAAGGSVLVADERRSRMASLA